jgi:hypothetical protein
MKKLLLSVALIAALAPAALAKTDALGLVPNDAVSVGVVKLIDLRTSPIAGALFDQTANVSMDADAMQFLRDAGLQPTKDIDVVVFSTAPRTALGSEAEVLVAADGRFNAERLGSALVSRGAVKKSSQYGAYYTLPEKQGDSPAVAFPSGSLVLMGTEEAVLQALASRAAGGTSFFTSSGLGRDMARVDPKAAGFALIDVARAQRLVGAPKMKSDSPQGLVINSALKSVSTVALWATDGGDVIKLGAFGLSRDTETLELLEDTIRGGLSAMRLAVQEKSPELVSTLRRFTVARSDDSVTVTGSVSAETFKAWAQKEKDQKDSK